MKRILLATGPRGAGKSTLGRDIVATHVPDVAYANRDDFLVARYSTHVWNSDMFSLQHGEAVFLAHAARLLTTHNTLILECFFHDKDGLMTIKDAFIPRADDYSTFMQELGLTAYLDIEEKEKDISFEALLCMTPPDICAQ